MWRPPQPGTLAVLRIQATVLMAALGLLVAGIVLSAGGLGTLTVKPVRTVSPEPSVPDSESPASPTPPTTPPPPPPPPPTTPPTSPPTSAPGQTPPPTGLYGPGARDGREIAQEAVQGNFPALLTTWVGFVTQLIGLGTALIGVYSGGRREAPASEREDRRTGRPARVMGAGQPRGRRPRRR